MKAEMPENFLRESILEGLDTKLVAQNLVFYQTTTSTNELAKTLASQGAVEGTVIVADTQTGGKGRRGRSWTSPAGQGLWMSVVLRPQLKPSEASKLTLLAAVAVVKAINRVCGLQVGIKWPNDIVYEGKKLAGILLEMSTIQGGIQYLVIGIGINVNIPLGKFSLELQDRASSLLQVSGQLVDRTALLQALLQELELAYLQLNCGQFELVLTDWREASVTLGQEVQVEDASELYLGTALDIDEQGALLLRLQNGEAVKVLSGDISVRSMKGSYY